MKTDRELEEESRTRLKEVESDLKMLDNITKGLAPILTPQPDMVVRLDLHIPISKAMKVLKLLEIELKGDIP